MEMNNKQNCMQAYYSYHSIPLLRRDGLNSKKMQLFTYHSLATDFLLNA